MAPPVGNVSSADPSYFYDDDSQQKNWTSVQVGESSIHEVAKRLQVDPDDLLAANTQINDPNKLEAGQVIHIPQADLANVFHDQSHYLGGAQNQQGKPAPAAGSIDAKSEAQMRLMQGTIQELSDKAFAAGFNPVVVFRIQTALVMSPPAQFNSTAALLRSAIDTTNPERLDMTLDSLKDGATNTATPQLVADYPISQGPEAVITTNDKVVTSYNGDAASHSHVYSNHVNDSGLLTYLSKVNGGRPLTKFEMNVVSQWSHGLENPVLTPVYRIGSQEVAGYKLQTGSSGNRSTTFYDRNGNALSAPSNDEHGVESEGLGPFEYIGVGLAVKGLAKGLYEGAAETFATRGPVVEGEAAAGAAAKGVPASDVEAPASTYSPESGRQGGGTSVHTKGASPEIPKSENFTATEKQAIKDLEDSGLSRQDAEQLIKEQRQVKVVPSSASWSGTPGPIGKKRYPY